MWYDISWIMNIKNELVYFGDFRQGKKSTPIHRNIKQLMMENISITTILLGRFVWDPGLAKL